MSLSYDLSQIRGRSGQTFAFTLTTKELDFGYHDWRIKGELEFSGTLKGAGYTIDLKSRVKARVESRCGKCLAPVEYEVDCPIEETLLFQGDTANVNTAEMEFGELGEVYWIYDKLVYDFAPMVIDVILNALPLVATCENGCKDEIIEQSEEPNTTVMDPRWAKLAQLKQDGEV